MDCGNPACRMRSGFNSQIKLFRGIRFADKLLIGCGAGYHDLRGDGA
jgi:hypothetical protein